MGKNNLELNEFIDQLFACIGDISPLVNQLNESISEAIHPAASVSENISKVSEANELATIDIMNMLDDTSDKSSNALVAIQDLKDSTIEYDKDFLNSLLETIQKKDNAKAESLIKDKIAKLNVADLSQLAKELEETFNTIIMNAQGIMMVLQVQDITTQQLAAIDHTVQTIQRKINSIIQMSSSVDTSKGIFAVPDMSLLQGNISQLHRAVVFDPKAINNMSNEHNQEDIDDLMKAFQSGADIDSITASASTGKASQDDIEALLNSFPTSTGCGVAGDKPAAPDETISADDIDDLLAANNKKPEPIAAPSNEKISADDINDLFAANNKKPEMKKEVMKNENSKKEYAEITQDDIDALFAR